MGLSSVAVSGVVPVAATVPVLWALTHTGTIEGPFLYYSTTAHRQKADTLAVSVLARLFLVLITPIVKSLASSCSVIFIRNSSLGSRV